MVHNAAFHQGLHCLLKQYWSSEKEIQYFFQNITCDPSIYTMDPPTVLYAALWNIPLAGKGLNTDFLNWNLWVMILTYILDVDNFLKSCCKRQLCGVPDQMAPLGAVWFRTVLFAHDFLCQSNLVILLFKLTGSLSENTSQLSYSN